MADESKGKSVAQQFYAKAERILREKHAEEFDSILQALYDEAGVPRRKRMTAEEREAAKKEAARQKALHNLQAILAEHPDLAEVATNGHSTE